MKWITTAVTLGATIVGAFHPDIQAWMGHHPQFMTLLGGLYAVFAGLLPSPIQPSK